MKGKKKNFFVQTTNKIKALFTKGNNSMMTSKKVDKLYNWLNEKEKEQFDIEVKYKYYNYTAYEHTKENALERARATVAGMPQFSKEHLIRMRNTNVWENVTIEDLLGDETPTSFKERVQNHVDAYTCYGMTKEEALEKAKGYVPCYNDKINDEMGELVFDKGIKLKFENERDEER